MMMMMRRRRRSQTAQQSLNKHYATHQPRETSDFIMSSSGKNSFAKISGGE